MFFTFVAMHSDVLHFFKEFFLFLVFVTDGPPSLSTPDVAIFK